MPGVTGIDPASGKIATVQAKQERGVNSLRSEDFFRLLVTELQQQDPLEPTKTEDMIGQVSQIRSIEQNERLNVALQRMTDQQRMLGGTDLLNKYVVAQSTDEAGNHLMAEGVVTSVRFAQDGTALLDLDNGQTVRAQDVQSVREPGDLPTASDRALVGGGQAKNGSANLSLPWLNLNWGVQPAAAKQLSAAPGNQRVLAN